MKVTIVGSGFVGQTTAMRVLQKGIAEVVLTDIVEGLPQGLALDMKESAPVERFEPLITGTNDYADAAGSDVVVITAGFPRQPGMSRMDLLGKNAAIIRSVVEQIAPASPEAIIVVVTNPLDEMTHLAWRVSGFAADRVVGMAGDLDSARLAWFLAERCGVPARRVEAMTLGSHGETMVPLPARARVDGRPATEQLGADDLDAVFQRTRDGGAEVVALLKRGSAFYAPSAATAAMVRAIVEDRREVHPACAYLGGEYGIEDVFLGVPAVLSRRGVEEVRELDLGPTELRALREAAAAVRRKCEELQQLLRA
jgi:malate dehydrogenase